MTTNCIKFTSADIETAKGTGSISTLTFDLDITVEPVASTNPMAPTHRVLGRSPRGKLVECGGTPRIKLSQELAKAPPARRPRTARAPPALTPRGPQVSVPGRKQLFRLLDAQGCAVADIMLNDAEVHSLPACLPAGAPDPPDPPWGRQRLARLSARAAAVGGCEGESQSGGRNPVLPPPGGVAAGGARGRAGGAAVHVCVGLRAAHGAAANAR